MEFKKSLNQSALQILEGYQSNESESEDGEIKDEAGNPKPDTSTPIDLAKSLENKKLKLRQLARKKLDLSPPPSPTKVTDKVCTFLTNPDPVLEPALAPVREGTNTEFPAEILGESRPGRSCAINRSHDGQAASDREAAGPKLDSENQAESRPRRSCMINRVTLPITMCFKV